MKNCLKTSIVCAICMLLTLSATAKSSDTVLRGPYLGQKPPGLMPEPFAPGVISTKMWEINGVFTPDMQSFYYIREIESEGQLHQQYVRYKNVGTHWQASVVSPRVGQPAFSPDGDTSSIVYLPISVGDEKHLDKADVCRSSGPKSKTSNTV